MSAPVVRWAFVSGQYAHAWEIIDPHPVDIKGRERPTWEASLCRNRTEPTAQIDRALDPEQRHLPAHLETRCRRCVEAVSKRGAVVIADPSKWPRVSSRPVDELALAWPDD